ncbi:hypothetical protein NDU88_004184 [Pleurodeles waltl]|uniref:Uncharacterized protein n=1 Tax=Pleurodeles waltl TaxID=8319 RepID=A0AAV7NKC9_PLEWA|nr:hypothetical protein NDU88_004184 [Pleurodeles waltl]
MVRSTTLANGIGYGLGRPRWPFHTPRSQCVVGFVRRSETYEPFEGGFRSGHRLLRHTGMPSRQRIGVRGIWGHLVRSAVHWLSRLGAWFADAHVFFDVGIVIEVGLLPDEGQAGILPDPLEDSTAGMHSKLAALMLSAEPIIISDSDEEFTLPDNTGCVAGLRFQGSLVWIVGHSLIRWAAKQASSWPFGR